MTPLMRVILGSLRQKEAPADTPSAKMGSVPSPCSRVQFSSMYFTPHLSLSYLHQQQGPTTLGMLPPSVQLCQLPCCLGPNAQRPGPPLLPATSGSACILCAPSRPARFLCPPPSPPRRTPHPTPTQQPHEKQRLSKSRLRESTASTA